ncbi:MAG TPA: substrate-binding domain-containing protein [Candidatus Sulfotelmatobacter sp.]|nr:substrate-binding domain-containing protein [Candidatus Sulfotelmatobacter sp.]
MHMQRWQAVPFFCLMLAACLTVGCNSSHNQQEQNNQIIGAGSTFINPIMTHWIADFQSSHPGVQINYQSIGSGGGIEQLKNGLVVSAPATPPSMIKNCRACRRWCRFPRAQDRFASPTTFPS